MVRSETTSRRVASIASKALLNPKSVSPAQVRTIAASVLTQTPSRGSSRTRKRR
jgi:hypothetical protein